MNKLLFLFLSTMYMSLSAQHQSKSSYKLGCKIGMDVRITGGRIKTPSKIAPEGGIWFSIKMSNNWTAQTEAILKKVPGL